MKAASTLMKPAWTLMVLTLLATPAYAQPNPTESAPASALPTSAPSLAPAASPPAILPDPEQQKFFLTLTQAIEIAQQNNHDILLAQEKIKDARLQVTENGAQGLPQLTATASYGRQDPVLSQQTTDTSGGGGAGLGSNPQFAAFLGTASVNTFNSAVTLNQLLFAGFRVIDGIRLARINVEMQEQALRQTRQNVAFQVTNAYFTALRALEVVELDKESLIQTREQIRIADVKLRAGAGVKLDLLQARSQEIQVQQRLSMDLNSYEKAKMSLNQVLGRETLYPITLNTFAAVADFNVDSQQGLKTALENRADLRQLKFSKEISELNATIQGRAVWPTISAQVRYNLQDQAVVGGNNRSVSNLNYGLNMNWPLFDGFATQAKAQRAQETALQAQISFDQMQQRVILDIEQSLLDIKEAQEREQMARAGVELAQENLRLAAVSYREGVSIMLNVITAQVNLEQAR
ncbi:MAG: TolC family protein, partial [Candidatus Sericytochromatia bacterium]